MVAFWSLFHGWFNILYGHINGLLFSLSRVFGVPSIVQAEPEFSVIGMARISVFKASSKPKNRLPSELQGIILSDVKAHPSWLSRVDFGLNRSDSGNL